MSSTAPETEAREALIALLETEFAPEGFIVKDDKLHPSLGHEGTVIGVHPDVSEPWTRSEYVQDSNVVVQFFNKYVLEIDPKQSVSPKIIEAYAHRFRERLRTSDPDTDNTWFFNLVRIRYPDDPTGNKTRFEANVKARGMNAAVSETK